MEERPRYWINNGPGGALNVQVERLLWLASRRIGCGLRLEAYEADV